MGRFPQFAVLVFVLCLASIGLPGLNNFVSEMLMLAGLFDARNPGIHRLGLAVVAAVGILLGAWYVLTLLQRAFFNPLREPPAVGAETPKDVTGREVVALGSIALLCVVLGLFPQTLLDPMRADVAAVSAIGDGARDRVTGVPPKVEMLPLPKEGPIGVGAGAGPPGGGKGKAAPKGGGKGGGKGKGPPGDE